MRFLPNYLWAVTVATGAWTISVEAKGIIGNFPAWRGFPIPIVLSDIAVTPLLFCTEWPVVALVALLPALVARSVEQRSHTRSAAAYVFAGILAGIASATAALFSILRWGADPDGFDPLYFYVNFGPLVLLAGGLGGLTYWWRAVHRLPSSSKSL